VDLPWVWHCHGVSSRNGVDVSAHISSTAFKRYSPIPRAPTSGGQYHWVSEFAPPEYQKVLSYVIGWLSTLSWQAGAAAGSYLGGTIIQALITVNNPDYHPESWQGTLLVLAMALVLFCANIGGARALPTVQNILLIVHVFSFFAIIFVIWFLAPLNSAEVVFTQFRNTGGWPSMGVSLMAGQISAIYGLICRTTRIRTRPQSTR
jgi:choline transport protein